MNKNKTVLVCGGAGYIGTHTTVELVQAGYDVVVLDNLSNSEKAAVEGVEMILGKKIKFYQIDCNDVNAMNDLFEKEQFNSIIHFAAYKAVGESVNEPLKYYNNNLQSLIVVMEMMTKHNVQNLVFSSSCTVYGQPDVLDRKSVV